MAITGIDYAGMLAKKNADTRKQIDNVKETYGENLERIKDRAHEKSKNQRDVYYKDRAELEKNMSNRIEEIRESNLAENKAIKKRLTHKLEEKDEDHYRELKKKSNEYRNKVEALNKVYDANKGEASKWAQSSKGDLEKSLEKKLKAVHQSHAQDLQEKELSQEIQNRKFQERLADDRRKMAREFQKSVDNLTSGKKKDRTNFRAQLDKVKDQYQKELSDYQSKAEQQKFNQLVKHKNDRDKIEGEMDDALHRIKVEQRNLLARKNDQYRDSLDKESKFFQEENARIKVDNDKKIVKIKDSYDLAIRDKDRHNKQVMEQSEERFDNKFKRQSKIHEDEVNNLIENSAQAAKKIKKDFSKKTIAKDKAHFKELKEFSDEANTTKNNLIQKFKGQQNQLKEVFKNENEIREFNNDRNIASLKSKHKLEAQKNMDNFNHTMKELQENSKRQKRRISLDNTKRVKELERKQVAETAYLKQQIANAAENDPNKSGSRAAFQKQQLEESFNNKVNNIKNSMADTKRNMIEDKALQAARFNDATKKMKAEHMLLNEKREADTNQYLNEKNQKFVREKNSIIANYKNKLSRSEQDADKYIRSETQKFKNKIEKKDQETELLVKKLVDKNRESLEKMQETNRKEKVKIIKKSQAQNNKELREMQKDNIIRLNSEKEAFDNYITNKDYENKRQVAQLNKKLRNVREKSNNEIKRIQAQTEEQLNEQLVDARNALEDSRLEFKQKLQMMRISNDKKLQKLKFESDKNMEKLQNESDSMLIEQRLELMKKNKKQLAHSEARFRHLAKMSEIEKESIRAQYEKRIEKMRQAHKEEMERKVLETKSMFL